MIKGLYEAHLPVSNLEKSTEFYRGLGLELAIQYEKTAFFWIEKNVSWLGLWEGEQVRTSYHPSLRHVAFRVELEDLKKAKEWLKEKGIIMREEFGFKPTEPIVMPDQAHAMVYFDDPDGNSIEFICKLNAEPETKPKMYLSDWEKERRN
ncbi:VOC family protein [Bacillus sp. 31A1R]|uniref:VOC family protein n=1 Tax=Robertmurraya mangrovi TaxID=3098077 RepID=A0ABU5IVW7_9BACI|nr:VOC family protein [Bacillus sp. 31A1R]MDZ5471297.1 VOC family protein [Bacillus sp. 31A1R]